MNGMLVFNERKYFEIGTQWQIKEFTCVSLT